VGAGIGGLAVAVELQQRAQSLPERLELICLDSSDRPGGHLGSGGDRGFLYEWAATGFLDGAPATLELIRRVGLERSIVRARDHALRRFVWVRGKLREVPRNPLAFLVSGLLTPPGVLRLLCEPLIPARPANGGEESVYRFVERRLGRRAAAVLIDAATTSVFSGDHRRLSLEATYPELRQMEIEHGSLFRALRARRKRERAEQHGGGSATSSPPLISFREGMQELVDALAGSLGPSLRLNTTVTRLACLGQRGFRLLLEQGTPIEVDAVVLACPAAAMAAIVSELDAELAAALGAVPSAPVALAHLGYRRDALPTRRDGLGFFIPRDQRLRTLATLWPSDIFEGRAPQGSQLISSLIGGAHDPSAVELDDNALLRIAKGDLETTMQIRVEPYFSRVTRNRLGLPQYELGHLDRVATAEQRLAQLPGLEVAGNSLHGVSVNRCIENAAGAAERTVEFLLEQAQSASDRKVR
jgi:oxygen-dependent protoporphyrinogen oxidase